MIVKKFLQRINNPNQDQSPIELLRLKNSKRQMQIEDYYKTAGDSTSALNETKGEG